MSKRSYYTRLSNENKFARFRFCNPSRFIADMKKRNRKQARRTLKHEGDKNE